MSPTQKQFHLEQRSVKSNFHQFSEVMVRRFEKQIARPGQRSMVSLIAAR